MPLISETSIAILVEHGVAQRDVVTPRDYLEKAGVNVVVVSRQWPEVKAWEDDNWGIRIRVNATPPQVSVEQYDGIIIPGGVLHTDRLRADPMALNLVTQFFASGKIIGVCGHGVQLLVSADLVEERRLTGSRSVRCDVVNAKGVFIDDPIVVDNGLVSCRSVHDIEQFSKTFLDELRQGVHQRTETII
jgi:protease I